MQTSRSPRSTYVAAFFLGALIALLLVRPGRAAEPAPLDRVGIVVFTDAGNNELLRQPGVLDATGLLLLRPGSKVARPANTPAAALGRTLISSEAWSAYYALGNGALQAFMLEEGAVTIAIGEEHYKFVARDPESQLYDGNPVNLSTRARLHDGLDQVIAGFVLEGRARLVLLRVAGPSLVAVGVPRAAPDPYLILRRNGEEIAANNNWSEQPQSALVARAAARAGAFPFPANSADAAIVVLLPPGVYTLHGSPAAPSLTPGEVLVEVYTLPVDVLFEPAE